MSSISFTQITDGSTIDATDVNTPLNTIYNDYNGNIDSNNLADNAVTTAKITDANVTAVKTSFGGNYSATEVDTGFTWIDAKHIYKKTVDIGAITAGKNVAHNITTIERVIKMEAMVLTAAGANYPVPLLSSSSGAALVGISVDGTNIMIGVVSNPATASGYVTLYYTKA